MSRPVHGEPDRVELGALGLAPSDVLDLSTNVARGAPPSAVLAAIRDADPRPYPDRRALAARRALASVYGCDVDGVLPGHGAAELIFSCTVAFALGRGRVLALGPTFGEPAHAAAALRVPYGEVRLGAADGFTPDLDALSRAITDDVALVYVCDPNNPTGRLLPEGGLEQLAAQTPGTVFLVDQSFRALSTAAERDEPAHTPRNLLRLRSLTKELAIAGVRVAVLLGAPDALVAVDGSRPSWAVSAAALAVLERLSEVGDDVARTRRRWLASRVSLERALRAAGLEVVPSETIYLLVRVGDADAVRAELLRSARLLVRSCTSFGLPEFVRVTACADEEREHVVRSMVAAVAAVAARTGGAR